MSDAGIPKVGFHVLTAAGFAGVGAWWSRVRADRTTGRAIREYLPKGTEIPQHQPYLTAIAEELNNRPHAIMKPNGR